MEARISGTTTMLGLIGNPVGHSGSPAIYNYAFAKLGIDYAYLAFQIDIDRVGDAMAAMRTFQMRGCNVTYPCKIEVMQYMDVLSPAAEMIGAVNTIVNEDGKLHGYNTDGEGLVMALHDHGIDIKGKSVMICGGGGAATSIQVQCALDGARELYFFNRPGKSFERAKAIAEEIQKKVKDVQIHLCDITDEETLRDAMQTVDILINATSVGMKPMDDQSIITHPEYFRPDMVVYDVVYNPVETRLLREAKAAGCRVLGGKGMLLWQAARAFLLYTGQEMPVEAVKAYCFGEETK